MTLSCQRVCSSFGLGTLGAGQKSSAAESKAEGSPGDHSNVGFLGSGKSRGNKQDNKQGRCWELGGHVLLVGDRRVIYNPEQTCSQESVLGFASWDIFLVWVSSVFTRKGGGQKSGLKLVRATGPRLVVLVRQPKRFGCCQHLHCAVETTGSAGLLLSRSLK